MFSFAEQQMLEADNRRGGGAPQKSGKVFGRHSSLQQFSPSLLAMILGEQPVAAIPKDFSRTPRIREENIPTKITSDKPGEVWKY